MRLFSTQAYQFLSENLADNNPNQDHDIHKNLFAVLAVSSSASAVHVKIDIQDVVSKAGLSHKALSAALFGADDASSAVQSATVVHNGRTLNVPLRSDDGSEEGSTSGLYEEGTRHLLFSVFHKRLLLFLF